MNRKLFTSILLVSFLLFSSFSYASSNVRISYNELEICNDVFNVQNESKWTVMYYMCCDSNMEEYREPLLENLSKIGSSNDFNLLALVDGEERFDSKIYYFNETGNKVSLNNLFGWPDEIDTSDPNTLEFYCKQMMNAYPAEHYTLITYASGGTGWQLYCLPDDSDGNHGVTIPQFASSMKYITNDGQEKIDVLFVSCAMGTIELSYEISPYVDYIIGTQDCLAKSDFIQRFYEPVWDLRNNSNMSAEEFAKRSPERLNPFSFHYFESYSGYLPILNRLLDRLPFSRLHTVLHHPSSSVINLSKINVLAMDLSKLSSYLILNMENKKMMDEIDTARSNVRESGKCFSKFKVFSLFHNRYNLEFMAYDSFIDLYDFIEVLKNTTSNEYLRNLCNNVIKSFNQSIEAIKTVQGDKSHGLNIYFPSTRNLYDKFVLPGKIPCSYENLLFSKDTKWDEFIKSYLDI